MNTSEIKRFKIMLESRLAALWGRVRNRNTIAIENTADTMDEVRLAEERDLANQILGRDFAELRLAEAALARIEDGSYGCCLRCEEPIRLNRLCVMPHAAFCVGCQEVAEQSGMSEFSPPEAATSTVRPKPSKSTIRSTPGRPPRLARPVRRNPTRTVAA
jgi:DnaK suppressor protein